MKCFQLFSQGMDSLFSSLSSVFFRNGGRACVPVTQIAVFQNASGHKMQIQFSVIPEGFEPTLHTSQPGILTISLWFGHDNVILDSLGNCCTTIVKRAAFTRYIQERQEKMA